MMIASLLSTARGPSLGLIPSSLLGLRHLGCSAPAQQAARTPPTLPPFSHVPAPYAGPSAEEVLSMRKQYLSPCEYMHVTHPCACSTGQYPCCDPG